MYEDDKKELKAQNAFKALKAVKILRQYRAKNTMVYELERDGLGLDVHFSPRTSAADCGEWQAEARTSHAAGAVTISEWGPTRAEALRELGRSWALKAPSLGLETFDWEAVERILTAVRAV